MNAEQMIDEVIDIVDDPTYEDRELILLRLNEGQRTLADALLLPDLKNGFDTVTTVAGEYEAALPSDYHKNIYLAMFAGEPVHVHADLATLRLAHRGLGLEEGAVVRVAPHRTNLIYQDVPAVPADIELFYYRVPTPMTDSPSSFPDGARGNVDFEWATIHFAAAALFNKIEDGMEGAKVNTAKHEELMALKMQALDIYADVKGKTVGYRPAYNGGWLGGA